MPRYSKKRTAVKKMWKRRPRGRRTVNVNRALSPFAQRYITKLKYSQPFVIDNFTPNYQFNLNSIFDPDRSGVGHQPYGFDQLAAIYNRYRVISCSWNINAISGTSAFRIAALPSNDAPLSLNMSYICENPRAKWAIQLPGGDTKTLRGKTYIPSLVGRTKAQYLADDRYQSLTTGSPSELALLNILVKDLQDGVGSGGQCVITMEYTVEFFDANVLGQS